MLAHRAIAVSALACFAARAALALPPHTIEPLLLEGDVVDGVTVASIDKVAINGAGDTIIMINAAAATPSERILRSGTVLYREGQSLVGPFGAASLRGFAATTANLANTGRTAINLMLADEFGFPQQGLYLGAGQPPLAFSEQLAYSDGRFAIWAGFHVARVNDAGRVLAVTSVDDFGLPGTSNRALIRLDLDAMGSVQSLTRLLLEGDTLLGQAQPVRTTTTSEHQVAFNSAGTFAFLAMLEADTPQQMAVDEALYLGTTVVLAQKGMPSPLPGRAWDSLAGAASAVDVSNTGSVAFRAAIAAPSQAVLVRDGVVLARAGQPAPGLPGRIITGFGPGSLPVRNDDAGRVLSGLTTDDPDPGRASALMLAGEVLVQSGVTMIGGQTLLALSTSPAGLDYADNGAFAIFIGELPSRPGSTGPAQGAFLVRFNLCRPDFNGDGTLNADDLSDYITAFFSPPHTPAVDYNNDGEVNADDLSDYITEFFLGC